MGARITLQELLSLEARASKLNLFQHKKTNASRLGSFHSAFRAKGMDFAEVRAYQPGDDIRQMDWRVMAKTRKPHIKCYEEERDRPFMILIDRRSSMRFGTQVAFKSVTAARIAALLAFSALKAGFRVGGVIVSDSAVTEIRPRAFKKGIFPLLHTIADTDNQPLSDNIEKTWQDGVDALSKITKTGTLFVKISDFQDIDTLHPALLGNLTRHNEGLALHVFDPLEAQAPPPGIYPIHQGRSRASWNTLHTKTTSLYQKQFLAHQHQINHLFKSTSMRCHSISNTDPLEVTLSHLFA